MNYILYLFGLLAISVIVFLIYKYVYAPWSRSMNLLDKGPNSLDAIKTYNFIPALDNYDNYTFSAYIYPGVSNRTKFMNSGSNNTGVSDKGVFPFLMWPDVFTFTTKAGEHKSILYVFAGQKSGKPNIIPIYCPMLPEQKWTFVAIVIDGRRFNVLYNGKIVASKLINEMPRLSKNGNLTSGYEGLTGEISDIKYINRAMSAEELMIEYTSTSDTRGRPYIDGGSILDIFGCPAGILCFKPKSPPSQGLLSWETPFS
jgi:hypothetical protein